MRTNFFKKLLAGAAFVAAVAFFWGATEAYLNYHWAPKGVWQADLWLPSTYNRVIFYAAVVGAASLLAVGLKGLTSRRRGRGRPSGRRWSGAVALAAVLAANVGWLVLGLGGGYELEVGRWAWDLQEKGPFFGYWGFYAVAGAGLAVGLGFGLGRPRWARAVGKYVRAFGAAAFAALIITHHVARALRPVPPGPNVILLVLDAWRAESARPELMPHLNAYARENALLFERAWSNATWTLPAMATTFTGQYPVTNKMRSRSDADEYSRTVAQVLRDAGYETTALTGNRILDRDHPITDGFENFYFSDWSPVLRAIHFYDTQWYGPAVRDLLHRPLTYEDSRVLTRLFASRLGRRPRRPYFLWVHYMDPHGPYAPPPGYYSPEDERFIQDYRPVIRKRRHALKRLYEDECRFMDDLLKPLFPRLAEERRTIVIITSDHGEEFWEHKSHCYGHGKSVYEALTRIPLFISVPGQPAGVVKTPVSLVDLGPTLLTLTGREPRPTMQGRPFITPEGPVRSSKRPVFIGSPFFKLEGNKPDRQDALIVWPRKLILRHEKLNARGEYYDLASDPDELRPLRKDKNMRRIRQALKEWNARVQFDHDYPDYGGAAAPDLRALGYIQ